MKKLLTLLSLVLTSLWASAAPTELSWTAPDQGTYPGSTVLYVQPDIDGTIFTPNHAVDYPEVKIAAFIGDECRGVATAVDGQDFFALRVWGSSEDANKDITVKMFYNSIVFSKSAFAKYTGETNPTVPMSMIIDTPTFVLGTKSETYDGDEILINQRLPYDFDFNDYITETYGPNMSTTKRTDAFDRETPVTFTFTLQDADAFANILEVAESGKSTAKAETAADNPAQVVFTASGLEYSLMTHSSQYLADGGAKVIIKAVVIYVDNITWKDGEPTLTVDVGDDVYQMIRDNITITPSDADNKELNFSTNTTTNPFPNGIAQTPGDYTITVTPADGSNVSIEVSVHVKEPIVLRFPAEIQISKYYTVSEKIEQIKGDDPYDPSLIEIMPFQDTERGVEITNEGGAAISFLGKKVGTYRYTILYNGKNPIEFYRGDDPATTNANDIEREGSLELPVEIKLPEDGWDWIGGIFANNFGLMTNNRYLPQLNQDENNRVIDMRSQTQLLYNDPNLGLFGDLTEIGIGMYKVKATYENTDASVIRTSQTYWETTKYTENTAGYNWVAYPNEFDMTFDHWNQNKGNGFANIEGDMIIGINGAATVIDGEWVPNPTTFKLVSGKGYLYKPNLAEDENSHYLNWAEVPEPTESTASKKMSGSKEQKFWDYDVTQHPDNMFVVARLEGLDDASDYTIGSFVNGECRGEGRIVNSNTALICASGVPGEKVSFKIIRKSTGEMFDIPESVGMAQSVGTVAKPLSLTNPCGGTNGITEIVTGSDNSDEVTFDLMGRRVNKSAKGILIRNGKKVIVK